MRTKQGRNDLCLCGSGRKYKKCCGATTSAPPAPPTRAKSIESDIADRRYLFQLTWDAFVTEFVARLRTFIGEDIPRPLLDGLDVNDVRYDGVVHIVPMLHRPSAGWGELPDTFVEIVRESQKELVECLEDLADRENIVVIAEGFDHSVDSASVAASAQTDSDLQKAMDGYGLVEFIVKNPHVPVTGGDIPHDLHTMLEQILQLAMRSSDAWPLFNVMQELRNRNAVQIALRAGRMLERTPVLVFGLDHAEGIAHAARQLAPKVALTLIPTVAVQSEHLFQPDSPLRQR